MSMYMRFSISVSTVNKYIYATDTSGKMDKGISHYNRNMYRNK